MYPLSEKEVFPSLAEPGTEGDEFFIYSGSARLLLLKPGMIAKRILSFSEGDKYA
ncbi:MAG: hypothetical protein MRK01_11225 [Candidatus Scalindua sp.]|nr:hypothetical protein [Candidatus Scalindua sp.]